jgi:hypothetical protein
VGLWDSNHHIEFFTTYEYLGHKGFMCNDTRYFEFSISVMNKIAALLFDLKLCLSCILSC